MTYPNATIERFWTKVVKADGCWQWTGSKAGGYGKMNLSAGTTYAHRISYELAYGPIPDGMFIDHLCRNRECTNPDHLRLVTPKQNGEHLSATPPTTSGHRGVSWRSDIRKWKGTVRCRDRYYHLGFFTDIDAAVAAVTAKRNELFTHNSTDPR